MNMRRLSITVLCLAGACAHGKSPPEQARAADAPKQVASTGDRSDLSDHSTEPEGDPERVDLPDSQRGRGRMASAGDELPADERDEKTPPAVGADRSSPDNTRVNERDRESSALTPMDQGESEADRELTQRIRKAVVGEDALSFSAKNVKIITRDGQVTLRGSVNREAERTTIERLAKDAAGPGRVRNELEVAN